MESSKPYWFIPPLAREAAKASGRPPLHDVQPLITGQPYETVASIDDWFELSRLDQFLEEMQILDACPGVAFIDRYMSPVRL